MRDAFGVDRGDSVSKAFALKPASSFVKGAANALRGVHGPATTPAGAAGAAAPGKAIGATKAFAAAKPKTTMAATVAGGGLVGGYAGSKLSKAFEPLSADEKKAYKMSGKEKTATGALTVAAGGGGFAAGLRGIKSKPGAIGAGVAAGSVAGAGLVGRRRVKRVNELRAAKGKKPRGFWTGQPKS
jgi:hypothetical protein